MIVHDVQQRSPEWHRLRLGRVTGTSAADMLTRRKDHVEAAGRRNLRIRLVLERLTGRSQESGYQSSAMLQGIEREPDAFEIYEAVTGRLLTSSGFITHDDLMAGCSLDGYVGDDAIDGFVEVKCPYAATHLEYLKTGKVPDDYLKQIQHCMWLTGARWADFVSFCPDFPEALQVKLVRVERVDAEMLAYELTLRNFLTEVDQEFEAVQQLARQAEAVA